VRVEGLVQIDGSNKSDTIAYTFPLPENFTPIGLLLDEVDLRGDYARSPVDDLFDWGRQTLSIPFVHGRFSLRGSGTIPSSLVLLAQQPNADLPYVKYERQPFNAALKFDSVMEGRYPFNTFAQRVMHENEGGTIAIATAKGRIELSVGYNEGVWMQRCMELHDNASKRGCTKQELRFYENPKTLYSASTMGKDLDSFTLEEAINQTKDLVQRLLL
jgi:hypothetical protein